jgi:hypothetical protein
VLLAASSSAAAHSPVSRAEVPWKGARTDFGSPVGHHTRNRNANPAQANRKTFYTVRFPSVHVTNERHLPEGEIACYFRSLHLKSNLL